MPYPGVPSRRISQFGVTRNQQCAGGGAGKIAQRGEISYHKSKERDDHEYIDGWASEPEYNFADAVLTEEPARQYEGCRGYCRSWLNGVGLEARGLPGG